MENSGRLVLEEIGPARWPSGFRWLGLDDPRGIGRPLAEPIAHIAPGTIGGVSNRFQWPCSPPSSVSVMSSRRSLIPLVHRLQREPSRHQEDADTTRGEREWHRNRRTRSGPIRQRRAPAPQPFGRSGIAGRVGDYVRGREALLLLHVVRRAQRLGGNRIMDATS